MVAAVVVVEVVTAVAAVVVVEVVFDVVVVVEEGDGRIIPFDPAWVLLEEAE